MKKIKGSEIINHITSDIHAKMPDIEQVREKCLNQEIVETPVDHNIQNKKRPISVFKPAKIIATSAAIMLVVGLINIQVVMAAVAGFVEETSKFIEKTFSNDSSYKVVVNTSPGNDGKFIGGGDKITFNLNVPQKESVIIQINRKDEKIEIATNDTVRIVKKNIVIGEDTVIEMNGNIIEYGTGSCTVTQPDGTVIAVNPPQFNQDDNVNELARTEYGESGISNSFIDMLPLISQDLIDEIAREEYEKSGIDALNNIFAYISEDAVEGLARKEYAANGLENFLYVYPYLRVSTLDELVNKEYEKSEQKNIPNEFLPFMSTAGIDELAKKAYEKSGLNNIPDEFLPFMSNATLDELAKNEYGKNGLKNIPDEVLVFMSKSAADEIAMKEYEYSGLYSLENIAQFTSKSLIEEIKQKEYEKTGKYPEINDNVGRSASWIKENVREVVETPFIGETRYITVEEKEATYEEITKIGKDGEFAEVYTKNSGKSNATANVTVRDGDRIVVVNKDKNGLISVTIEQDGNSETAEINPELNPEMTVELNGKTIKISQASKGGTTYVTITKSDITARIKITKKAEINVLDYLITTPLYGD